MVKAVSFEEYFEERCLRASQFTYGIIIGGTIKDEECFFLPIGAPHKPNDNTVITNIDEIDKNWVHKHCKNVKRMLPGNVRISGFFLTVSETQPPNKESILEILKEIYDSDKCNLKDLIHDDHSEKLVLMINTDTNKLSCYSIDTEDISDTLRQVEIRIRPVLNRWKAIRSSTSLSAEVKLSSDRRKEKILSKLEQVVVPYLRSLVNDTEIMVCNEKLADNIPLFEYYANTQIPYKKKPQSLKLKNVLIDTSSSDIDNEEYWSNLDFVFYGSNASLGINTCSSGSESGASSDTGIQNYCPPLEHLNPKEDVETNNRNSDSFEKSLSLHGIIPGIAFLPLNATVGQAKNALRRDLVRSTLARLELITDELHISSGQIEVSRIYLPQRVLVRLPACRSLPLSDYKFSSETPDDVVSRLIYYSLPLGSSQYDSNYAGMIRSASHDGSFFAKITQPIQKLTVTRNASYAEIIATSLKKINPVLVDAFDSAKSIGSSSNSIPDDIEEIDSGHETADCEIAIDTNCLSFGLEDEPNLGTIPDDLSKIGVINDIDTNIKHAVRHRSSLALFIIGSLCILMLALFIAYFKMAE